MVETMTGPALLAPQYLTRIARAYAAAVGAPEPPATRANYVTLHKARVGVAVQAWFRRVTPSKFPEVRVGVTFRFDDGRANAAAAEAFASRFASDLNALGVEAWPSETNNDRRFTTPLPVPLPGQDLGPFVARGVELARGYVELLKSET